MKHIGMVTLLIAIIGAVVAALMLFGARAGVWEPITGFGLYRTYFNPLSAVITGTGLLALIFHLVRKEKFQAMVGSIAALIGIAFLIPLVSSTLNPKPRAAPIHNISTDTANPPAFEVLDETRAGARNSLKYGGTKLAEAQAAAYPDIAPLKTDLSTNQAFQRALSVAQNMGWEIVASDAQRFRFEATARTPVFYFADDVVVVVTPQGDGSRIDMRSVSRIGRSDLGVNAARIRNFQQRFQN